MNENSLNLDLKIAEIRLLHAQAHQIELQNKVFAKNNRTTVEEK